MDQAAMLEYTMVWSCLGYPCATLPVTKVEEHEQFFNDHFQDAWTHSLSKNAQKTADLPIALQIVGYPSEDERVLALTKLLQESLEFEDAKVEEKLDPLSQPEIQAEILRRSEEAKASASGGKVSGTRLSGTRMSAAVISGSRPSGSSGANGDLRKRVSEGTELQTDKLEDKPEEDKMEQDVTGVESENQGDRKLSGNLS